MEGESAPAELKNLPEVQVLKTVWAQQFREVEGKIIYQAGTTYDGHVQIQTPHDPEARYSRKRVQEWIGGKVQVTETDDEEYPHVITDIAGTCSSKTDYEALAEIQERLIERQCIPEKQYVDSKYVSGPNSAIWLVSPTPCCKRLDKGRQPMSLMDYHKHRSGVDDCLSTLVLGNGMHVSRYTGNQKRSLQTIFAGTIANLKWVAH